MGALAYFEETYFEHIKRNFVEVAGAELYVRVYYGIRDQQEYCTRTDASI